MVALLAKIDPGNAWRNRLKDLLTTHPFIKTADMGFPFGWDTLPFWR